MNRRQSILSFFSGLAALIGGKAFAAGVIPYEAKNFPALLSRSGTLIVHVHAETSPISVRQVLVLNYLAAKPVYADIPFVAVSFDKDHDFLRQYAIDRESTILVFKGGRMVSKFHDITNPDRIARYLKEALATN